MFDYAEAFTVIDVNTGRFVGGRGKSSNARLEDTITKNNLEAVTEVVRQLRLRDIGGIIVIDFIDMANPKNRQFVEGALNTELGRDRTKTYGTISLLGLVEATRQNVTDGPREILTGQVRGLRLDGCRRLGRSPVPSRSSASSAARRRVSGRGLPRRAHSDVAAILIGANGERLAELERETGKRFGFKTKKSFRLDRFAVIAEGKAAKIEGSSSGPRAERRRLPSSARARPRSRRSSRLARLCSPTMKESRSRRPRWPKRAPTATSPRPSRRRERAEARVAAAVARRRWRWPRRRGRGRRGRGGQRQAGRAC